MGRGPSVGVAVGVTTALAVLAVLGAAVTTEARKPAPTLTAPVPGAPGVVVDWGAGVVIARGGSAADLRAPTATIARIKAERTARRVATDKAVAAAASLAMRKGLRADTGSARWKALAADAIDRSVRYSSDGSAIVEVGLPLESVRRALVKADLSPPTAPEPTALVIDARAIAVTPVVGLRATAGSEIYDGPVLYARKAPGKSPLGRKPARVTARAHADGVLDLGADAAKTLAAARAAGAPTFVLIK